MLKVVDDVRDANCITHSGTMHADEVFSSAFLELFLGNVRIYRTNNISNITISPDMLIYDIGRGKFDHHQMEALKRENGIPYCSFGLLWKEFGISFLENYGLKNPFKVFSEIDKDLVEGIDADDNGIFPKTESSFKIKMLPNIIKMFNPSFNTNQNESEQFEKACSIAKKILEEEILYINGKVEAEEKLLEQLSKVEKNAKYIVLDKYLPYEETILGNSEYDNILFVAYPSNRGGYAIKVVPKNFEDRTARMSFPKEWAGLEKSELVKVSGIEGLTFCHLGRFLVACNDLETVYLVLNKILVDC